MASASERIKDFAVTASGETFLLVNGSGGQSIRKLGVDGMQQWLLRSYPVSVGATEPAGDLVVAGLEIGEVGTEVFVAKLDTDGNERWRQRYQGSEGDQLMAVVVDGSGASWTLGTTRGAFAATLAGEADLFAIRVTDEGKRATTLQLGSSGEEAFSDWATDEQGNIYLAGTTTGPLLGEHVGHQDVFVIKLDSEGNTLWAHQLGSEQNDAVVDLALHPDGTLYIAGVTDGHLQGESAGGADAFVSRFDAQGERLWTQQFGSSEADGASAIAFDASGRVFVAGYTDGQLGLESEATGRDIFITRVAE